MAVYLGSNEVDILGGQTTSVTVNSLNVTSNGTYTAPSGMAYSPVSVTVSPNLTTKSITQNGTYTASSDSADGYSSVTVNVSGGSGSDGTLKVITSSTQQIDSSGSTLTFSGLSSAPTSFFVKLYPSPSNDLYIMRGNSEYIFVTGVTGDSSGTAIFLDCLHNNLIYNKVFSVGSGSSSVSVSYNNGVLNIRIPLVDSNNWPLYLGVASSDISGQDIESSFVLYYI